MDSEKSPSQPDKSRYARSLVRLEPVAPTLIRRADRATDRVADARTPDDGLAVPRDMLRPIVRERARRTPVAAVAALIVAALALGSYAAWPFIFSDTAPPSSSVASQPVVPSEPPPSLAAATGIGDAGLNAQQAAVEQQKQAAEQARKMAEKARLAALAQRQRLAKAERDRKTALRRAARAEQARLQDAKIAQARIDRARLDQMRFDQARIQQLKAAHAKQLQAQQAAQDKTRQDAAKEQARQEARLKQAKLREAKLEQARKARAESAALTPQSAPGESPPLDATDLPPRAANAAPPLTDSRDIDTQ